MTARVLIVDDEFGLADVVAEILVDAGFEAELAINGQLALASMAEVVPDLVLLDTMMPVLDGAATLRTMRADARLASVPVVLMCVRSEALPEEGPSGHQDVLEKPFTPAALLAAVRRLTG
jgi:DNA-binding response OmpR family regulator